MRGIGIGWHGIVAVSERNVGEVKVGLEAVRTLGKIWVAS